MLVGERMTRPVLTVSPDVPVQDALARMRRDKVRRYPVIDNNSKLIGIVTDSDLLNASPTEATTLSVWEINYLLSKITVERVMSKNVITTCESCPIEEAARIMADHKIGGLPVIEGDKLVGIITETDIFHIFLEMLGARNPGVRLTVELLDSPGKLRELASAIAEIGGNIDGLGIILGASTKTRLMMVKVTHVSLTELESAVKPVVEKIVDIRDVKST